MDQKSCQIELVAKRLGYKSGERYRKRGEHLFGGIPLAGSSLLDVGCGAGAWALWAALNGAVRVVGIEPEAHGSTNNTLARFRDTIISQNLERIVTASANFLDQLSTDLAPFDVVVLFNVINHLDEEAVVGLHRDEALAMRYISILQHLRQFVKRDGWVIVADCARGTIWTRLGLPSPFAPGIEWHKHQNPETWCKLFEQAGFRMKDLRWSPAQPLGLLTSNRLAQYLIASHFVLRFQKNE